MSSSASNFHNQGRRGEGWFTTHGKREKKSRKVFDFSDFIWRQNKE